jgi:hypothetical protein
MTDKEIRRFITDFEKEDMAGKIEMVKLLDGTAREQEKEKELKKRFRSDK